ncbi:FN3 associated domain-containing protein [Clostridium sardiniense]|uniref:FN3 associated domain-containing protein n=1 Tax=Clostridium sardiniense TaxID=29369 RepID=UPI003D3440F9
MKPRDRAPTIVNIYNFIRKTVYPSGEFVKDDFDTVLYQMETLKRYNLPATYALKYDALMDDRYSNLIKENIDDYDEVAVWWEIDETLAKKANVEWKGKTPVDDHVNIGYSLGYKPEDRIKMVDVYMEDFKDIFGYYPKTVGSWVIDIITLNYFKEKYGVVAAALCRDQIGTDGFTLWGGYFSQGYYPSKFNEYIPAQSTEMQIDTPIFRMLGPDPIYSFEDGLRKSVTGVHTLEPASVIGQTEEWVKWLLDRFTKEEVLGFSYVQAGQENTFLWNTMRKGYELQIPYIAELERIGEVRVQTLEETGKWYKKRYNLTPPTTFVASEDWNKEENLRTVWYNSRFYRVSFLWEDNKLSIRDLHLFNENYKSRYYDDTLDDNESIFDALPVLNAHKWSDDESRASIDFITLDSDNKIQSLKGKEPRFSTNGESIYNIEWKCENYNFVIINCNESKIKIAMKSISSNDKKLAIHINKLPILKDLNRKMLICNHNGFEYRISLDDGDFKLQNDGSILIISEKNEITIVLSKNNIPNESDEFLNKEFIENIESIDKYIPINRRVTKNSKMKLRALKPNIIPNVILSKNNDAQIFKIENNEENGEIHYTLDGSTPDIESPVYEKPIILDKELTIKAIAFKDGFKESEVVEGRLYKTISIKDIIGNTKPVDIDKFNKKGIYDLIDGNKGTSDYTDGNWLGYYEDMDVTVDLGEIKKINSITVGFLQDTRAWIYYPRYVDFEVSVDGKAFKKIDRIYNENSSPRIEVGVKNISTNSVANIRYIRIFAKNEDLCPDWSIMAGEGPAFMFVDQVTIV